MCVCVCVCVQKVMRAGIMGIERSIDKKQRETGKEVSQVSLLLRRFKKRKEKAGHFVDVYQNSINIIEFVLVVTD